MGRGLPIQGAGRAARLSGLLRPLGSQFGRAITPWRYVIVWLSPALPSRPPWVFHPKVDVFACVGLTSATSSRVTNLETKYMPGFLSR
jgi:hypothetical protein